jgi:tRNA(Ile2) C34 agmatinyltransferase TiaS
MKSLPLYPVRRPVLRRSLARQDICPECGGALDTGWECNSCGYDAQIEATQKGDAPSSQFLIAEGKRAAKSVRR